MCNNYCIEKFPLLPPSLSSNIRLEQSIVSDSNRKKCSEANSTKRNIIKTSEADKSYRFVSIYVSWTVYVSQVNLFGKLPLPK
jgi:hypothetical protein